MNQHSGRHTQRRVLIYLSLLLVLLLAAAMTTQAQDDDETVIRAVWTSDVFVLLNMSDEGVDLSGLLLESAFGEISAEDWEMNRNPETERLYILADVRPGSCLVAAFGTTEPVLPSGVVCTRVIGQIVISSRDEIIWSIDQGGFTPYIDDELGEDCSIRTSSCDIVVPLVGEAITSAEDAGEAPEEIETTTIRALWTPRILVLINVSADGADLTNLRLESTLGQINPDDWTLDFSPQQDAPYTLDDVRPGSCLLAYVGEARPNLPPNVTCTRIIGQFSFDDLRNVVWDVSQGGFTPFLDNVPGTACSIQRTSCDIEVINADAVRTAAVDIRAVWDDTVFVLMNESSVSADLSTLDLVSGAGFILADDWEVRGSRTLDAFAPGDCLVAYANSEDPEDLPLPEAMACNLIVGTYEVLEPIDFIWQQETFTPEVEGEAGEDCFGEDGTCVISVPAAN